jgi:hypothetical protein
MPAVDGKVNALKDKEENLSALLPDIRLLYGTQPGTRTPVMYQPGIVFSFPAIKLATSMSGLSL